MENNQTQANREFRSSSFAFIFGRPHGRKFLLQIANKIFGTNYTDVDDVTITTLEDVMYVSIKNDVSFAITNRMLLMEHQSTPNRNMVIRQLEYYVKVIDKYMSANGYDVHKDAFIPLDLPVFITFFEGNHPAEEYYEERLSDHFKIRTDRPSIELVNMCYNLGEKMNLELKKACPALEEYHWLNYNIQENAKKMSFEEAIDKTLKEMPKDFEIYAIFQKENVEAREMLITEYNEKYAQDLYYSNGYDKGKEEGRQEGIAEGKEQGIAEEQARNFNSMVEMLMKDFGCTKEEAEAKAKTTLKID